MPMCLSARYPIGHSPKAMGGSRKDSLWPGGNVVRSGCWQQSPIGPQSKSGPCHSSFTINLLIYPVISLSDSDLKPSPVTCGPRTREAANVLIPRREGERGRGRPFPMSRVLTTRCPRCWCPLVWVSLSSGHGNHMTHSSSGCPFFWVLLQISPPCFHQMC